MYLIHCYSNFQRMIMMSTLLLLTLLLGGSLGQDKVQHNCRYNVYKNKDCPSTIDNEDVDKHDNIERCMDRCDMMDNCMGFLRRDDFCEYKPLKCKVQDLVKSTNVFYAKPLGVYKVEPSSDCLGTNIGNTFHKSRPGGCMKECDKTDECVAFFRNSSGYCWMKSKCNTRSTSYVGDLFLSKLGQFQYLPNHNCKDNDIYSNTVESPGACLQKCSNNKDCVAVSFKPSGRLCRLKHRCTNIVESVNSDIYLAPDCIDSLPADSYTDPRVDCGSVGGDCRDRRCEKGQKKCVGQTKCGTGKGKVCCCTIWNAKKCTNKGGVCRPIERCRNNEEASGTCDKRQVCCSKRDVPTTGRVVAVTDGDPTLGTTCSSIGGTCVPEIDSCVQDCPNQTCMPGQKCCCRVVAVTDD